MKMSQSSSAMLNYNYIISAEEKNAENYPNSQILPNLITKENHF